MHLSTNKAKNKANRNQVHYEIRTLHTNEDSLFVTHLCAVVYILRHGISAGATVAGVGCPRVFGVLLLCRRRRRVGSVVEQTGHGQPQLGTAAGRPEVRHQRRRRAGRAALQAQQGGCLPLPHLSQPVGGVGHEGQVGVDQGRLETGADGVPVQGGTVGQRRTARLTVTRRDGSRSDETSPVEISQQ